MKVYQVLLFNHNQHDFFYLPISFELHYEEISLSLVEWTKSSHKLFLLTELIIIITFETIFSI